jgi:hypothetical protein
VYLVNATDLIDPVDVALFVRWQKEHEQAQEDFRSAALRMTALKKMMDGMIELHPGLKRTPKTEQNEPDMILPSGHILEVKPPPSVNVADVVRDILRKNPERWFTSGAMVKAVEAEGVQATHTSIRLALRRTGERGYSVKRGDGKGQSFRLHQESVGADLFGGVES